MRGIRGEDIGGIRGEDITRVYRSYTVSITRLDTPKHRPNRNTRIVRVVITCYNN